MHDHERRSTMRNMRMMPVPYAMHMPCMPALIDHDAMCNNEWESPRQVTHVHVTLRILASYFAYWLARDHVNDS